jgi:hypothetical protein
MSSTSNTEAKGGKKEQLERQIAEFDYLFERKAKLRETLVNNPNRDKKKNYNTSQYCYFQDCHGGKAFEIRGKMFCSPKCGNFHFGLTPSDDDYCSHSESEQGDDRSYNDSSSGNNINNQDPSSGDNTNHTAAIDYFRHVIQSNDLSNEDIIYFKRLIDYLIQDAS